MKKLRSYYSNVRHHQKHDQERTWFLFPIVIASIFAFFSLFLKIGACFLPFNQPVLLNGSGSSSFVESMIKPISSLPTHDSLT
ncbi:hypothetical protein Bca52824_034537 [Brassica carinata]|uniref:Uncharacterized protein n=1 Tax=Brassica carinata TaxID=52824 RepID=A0A8X7UZJ1_BRACI|nr:hypothetical protein Bca52824_034537 [Brassica carinata]